MFFLYMCKCVYVFSIIFLILTTFLRVKVREWGLLGVKINKDGLFRNVDFSTQFQPSSSIFNIFFPYRLASSWGMIMNKLEFTLSRIKCNALDINDENKVFCLECQTRGSERCQSKNCSIKFFKRKLRGVRDEMILKNYAKKSSYFMR